MNHLSLFTGVGGGELAFQHLLKGFKTIGYVEYEEYCQKVIRQRIKDGLMHNAPIYGDIRTFIDSGCAELYRGIADVVSGGFPCQPFSVAGKRKAESDERNMWPAAVETVKIIKPKFAFFENVPGLLSANEERCKKCNIKTEWIEVETETERAGYPVCPTCKRQMDKTTVRHVYYYNRILRDLAEIGYNARWTVLGAKDVGARHKRDRLWIVANPNK